MLTRAQELSDTLVNLRRAVHRHPELGLQEHRTAKLVAERLAELGIGAHRRGQDRRRQAPNLIPVFESGGTGARLEDLTIAIGESRTYQKAVAALRILREEVDRDKPYI